MAINTARLYDQANEEIWNAPLDLRVIYEVDFPDMPFYAQQYAKDLAVERFLMTQGATQVQLQARMAVTKQSYALLNEQHIRETQVNMLEKPSAAEKLFFSRGVRPYSHRR